MKKGTSIPKSLGGALTDAQHEKLTGAKTGKASEYQINIVQRLEPAIIELLVLKS